MKRHLKLIGVISVTLIILFGPVYAVDVTLRDLDSAHINECQSRAQFASKQVAMVCTIEYLLDCAASGRLNVSLIGLNEVPPWVVETWQSHEPNATEVSISRYNMALDVKHPDFRTDFFRFRSTRENGEIVETLLQDIRKDKKAVVIFTFIDGDPNRNDKQVQRVLNELLYSVEEGEITVKNMKMHEAPLYVMNLWRQNALPGYIPERVLVQKYVANTPGGDEVYWRVTYADFAAGLEQIILVNRNQLIFSRRNYSIRS